VDEPKNTSYLSILVVKIINKTVYLFYRFLLLAFTVICCFMLFCIICTLMYAAVQSLTGKL